MRLGIVDSANLDASDNLYQDIALPDSAQHFTLSFHYWASHENAPGSDLQLLNIYEATTGVRLAQPWSRLSNEQSWQFEQIDLTHFRGRTLRIEFGLHNDGSGGRTALYLDDVSLLACEPGATPFVTPSATAAAPQPSATPQPVATPAPGGCVVSDTLSNGGFENTLDGQLNWSTGESPVPPVLSNQPSGGAWSLRLGNPPGSSTQNILSYSSVRQFIQLPANASSASLSWSHLSRSQEPATISPALASDRQELILLTSSLATEGDPLSKSCGKRDLGDGDGRSDPLPGRIVLSLLQCLQRRQRQAHLDVPGRCAGARLLRECGCAESPAGARPMLSSQPRPPAATSSQQDKSAVAQPGSGTQTPAADATAEADAGATQTPAVRGTIIAVGMSTPSSIIKKSGPSAGPSQIADVTVWQRFLRISQTAQGQTFLFLLMIVLVAIGYLRFRGSVRPPP